MHAEAVAIYLQVSIKAIATFSTNILGKVWCRESEYIKNKLSNENPFDSHILFYDDNRGENHWLELFKSQNKSWKHCSSPKILTKDLSPMEHVQKHSLINEISKTSTKNGRFSYFAWKPSVFSKLY